MFFWQVQIMALVYIHRPAFTCPTISVLLGAATNSFSPSSVQLPVLSIATLAQTEIVFRMHSVVDVSYITNVRRQELFHFWTFFVHFWAIKEFLEVHSSALRSGRRWGSLPIMGDGSRLQNMKCRTFFVQAAETRASLFRTRTTTNSRACHIHQPQSSSSRAQGGVSFVAKSAPRNRGQHGPNMDLRPLCRFCFTQGTFALVWCE